MTDIKQILKDLDLDQTNLGACTGTWIEPTEAKTLVSVNPATGEPIATVIQADAGRLRKGRSPPRPRPSPPGA